MRLRLAVKDMAYNLRLLKEIIYPRRCAVCHCVIDDGCFCQACRRGYLLKKHHSFEEHFVGLQELQPEDVLSEAVLLYKYDGAVKEALHRLKFEADYDWLPVLREELSMALPKCFEQWLQGFDYVCCIPTSAERLEQRGFDIPQELFKAVLQSGVCTYAPDILVRARQTAPLFALNKEQRRQELWGCFAVPEGVDVRGKRILLCDDIYTTGSTFAEAGMVLLQAGAASVAALAFAAARENW